MTRLSFAGRTVIRQELLGPDAQRRAQRDLAILERLRDVEGVAQLVEAPHDPRSVVVADAGGTSLAELAKPLAVDELIPLAVRLARAVTGMHRRGVIHRDITPANILISGDGAPCLVDFALATSFAELRPEFTHHTEIVGTLAYLAPEQTGRTARPVDQRADLYALGATLYELATGEPPFGSGDPLRLTHDHLARVAVPPAAVNPAVPGLLSEIIMHLLEKEPDNRYQTADGVVYDLERLQEADARPGAAALRVGEHDVPLRLLPPSRLVGRDDEVAALGAAFTDAQAGRCRGVLISGAPGVGKTALVDELRPVVTGSDGWFVTGKFDQYRRDLESDGVYLAFRGLGRLLLAEPEAELTEVRERILDAVGPNAGLVTAVSPEFAALLAVPPDPGDPLTTQVRAQQTTVQMLRAIASRKRPVVLFVDDLQWAGHTPIGFVDLVLSEEQIDGLLLVGAYREDDTNAASPLVTPLSRWRQQPGVQHIRLDNLPVSSSISMVVEMLRVDEATAASLVKVINPYTSGNPYDTVELLNALRHKGVLTASAAGWRWGEAAVRAHLGHSDFSELLAARVDDMPMMSRTTVEAMACLGGQVELSVLQTATAEPTDVMERRLAPALDNGVLVLEPGLRQTVRFRHDRIREVILRGLHPQQLPTLRLAMARRLAAVPELYAVAAEQYRPVVDAVDDAAERRQVVELLRRAAHQATLIGDYSLVHALLSAALRLVDPGETATLVELHTGRHAALYSIGRLEEADELYHTIERLCTTPVQRADATCVHLRSLTHRHRLAEVMDLGLASLRELGIAVPTADQLPAQLDHQFTYLRQWLDSTADPDEPSRPDITEPVLLAATRVLDAVLPGIYQVDLNLQAWLSLEALRIWTEHGPARTLVGPASTAALDTMMLRGDHTADQAIQRTLALGLAHGYEPDTSQARFVSALVRCWSEPIEVTVRIAQQAREGLIAGGDLANAGYSYYPTVAGLLECAPSLDACEAAVDAAVAFMSRSGSEQANQWVESYRWLATVLRGEHSAATVAAIPAERYASHPMALLIAHVTRAIAAAVFDDLVGLTRHTAAATLLLPNGLGLYSTAQARLLRGLALAAQARASHGSTRDDRLSELDDETRWMAARAAVAPANFLHLLRLLEAERAWAVGDFHASVLGFDAARHEVARHQRPWHRALITERMARFYLAHGVEHASYDLLAEARRAYLAWGANAKVDQLDWAYPTLRPRTPPIAGHHADRPDTADPVRSTVTTGTIDLLGILRASQALSSETDVTGLRSRLVEVLSAMTGATGVHLLLWSDDRQEWLLPAPDGEVVVIPVGSMSQEQTVPMSVLRYAVRMREPLVVADARSDDRFARDPYFAELTCCSLLAVPFPSRGTLQAVLLLENRLIRGAFTTDRLDGVKLIAGQLAVSLDNAQLYAEFRRIADEQAALRRVATLVACGARPDLVFAAVAKEVGTLFGADTTEILRFESDRDVTVMGCYGLEHPQPGSRSTPDHRSTMASVQATGRAARHDGDDATAEHQHESKPAGDCSAIASPIVVEDRVWGAMGVASRRERLPEDTEQRLADFTELVATAIANAESRAELTTSRARIVAAADQARRRIERDLHDGAQQRLVTLALHLRAAQAALTPEFDAIAGELDRAVGGATGALEELRETARGIHPAILTEGGLRPALRMLARRSPIPVDLGMPAVGRLPEQVEVSAYYIVAEALTNAAKHARASAVTITVEADMADPAGAVLRVDVRDDGAGGADFAQGTGLAGLKDRVDALSGRIYLDSPRGVGTSLRVELPLTDTNGITSR
ncbi:AAA family ATPase [Dactylosporangium sp. NPDC005572]|uniref:AAA family ATPase n=1 Tax=Dactylosporangium sp. NPDC005572 TaxID=3156889 RepID=UPI0033A5C98D